MKDKKQQSQNLFEQLVTELVNGLSDHLTRWLAVLIGKFTEFISTSWGNNKSGSNKVEYGYTKINPDEMGLLGYSNSSRKKIYHEDVEWKMHAFVVGASGTGKTSFIKLAIEGAFLKNSNVVLIDPKGGIDFIRTFKAMSKKHNKKFYIFCEGYEGEGAIRLNPFKGRDYTDITSMFRNCMFNDSDEPFYRDAQIEVVNSIIEQLLNDRKEVSLWSIYAIFMKDFAHDDDYKGLKNKLNNLLKTSLGILLKEENSKSISDIVDEGANVFIAVNMQRHGETGRMLCKFFVNEVLKLSGSRASRAMNLKYAPTCSLILDEIGSIIEPEFLEIVNKSRESRVWITALAQSFNDLKRAFRTWSGWESLWESFSTWIVFRQSNDEYVERFAKIAGTQMIKKKTYQLNDGVQTGGASSRDVHEFNIHPETIRRLGVGQAILVSNKGMGGRVVEHLTFRNMEESTLYDVENQKMEISGLRDFKKEWEQKNLEKNRPNNKSNSEDEINEFLEAKFKLLKEFGGQSDKQVEGQWNKQDLN